jgi:hypothetical protein
MLAIASACASDRQSGWQRDLSVSYNKVGDVLVAQGKLDEALKSYRDSLAIAERLAASIAATPVGSAISRCRTKGRRTSTGAHGMARHRERLAEEASVMVRAPAIAGAAASIVGSGRLVGQCGNPCSACNACLGAYVLVAQRSRSEDYRRLARAPG